MVTACVSPFFSKSSVKKPLSLLAVVLVAVLSRTLPNYGTGWHLRDLLVDGLLGYLMVAAVLMIVEYRQDCYRACLCSLPVFLLLTLVKDSGKILMLIGFALLLFTVPRPVRKNGRSLAAVFSCLLIPLGASHLWKRYVQKAYPSMAFSDNKFAFTEEKIEQLIDARPDGFFDTLPSQILTRAFDPQSFLTNLLIVVAAVAVIVLIGLLLARKKVKLLVGALVFCVVFLGLYLVMLGVLYGMLFTPEEAVTLDSFSRYVNTPYLVVVSLLSLAVVYSLAEAAVTGPVLSRTAALLCAVVLTIAGWPGLKHSLAPAAGESARRIGVRAAYGEGRELLDGKTRPLVYIHTRTDTGYLWFASLYEFWQSRPVFMTKEQARDLSLLRNADVLLIVSGQEELLTLLREQGVTVSGEADCRAYRIDKTDGSLSLTGVR